MYFHCISVRLVPYDAWDIYMINAVDAGVYEYGCRDGSQGMRRCNAERWRHNKDKTSDAERKSQGYGYRTTGVEPVFERYMKENKK